MINPTGMNAEALLQQIRQFSNQTQQVGNTSATQGVNFADAVANGIKEVNTLQQTAAAQRNAYDAGQDVPLTDVVISMQKSSLAFEATLQIRNKVMKAYEDIMNMPV
jgi:flagellar hook-basal body complex protein FliE